MTTDSLKNFVSSTPSVPGIYMFIADGKEIYIGKAANLKNRLRSYLKTTDPRIQKMLSVSEKIEFKETDSDIEALILESQLIKNLRPQFNIMLRDDKQYFYVVFTAEKFPKIFLTHQPKLTKLAYANFVSYKFDKAKFIGPFTDGAALKTTMRFLRSVFPYCTCKQLHHNRCLNYHIGKCPGFCCLRSDASSKEKKAYTGNIKAVREILNGKKNSLVKELMASADNAARKNNFEKAIELRNKIEKLERIFRNARIIKNSELIKAHSSGLEKLLRTGKPVVRIEGYDVSNIQGAHATGSMVTFVSGRPDKNSYRKFKIFRKKTADDTAMLKEILERRFKHDEWPFPDLILLDGGKGQVNTGVSIVKRLKLNIPVIGVSKNERHVGHRLVIPGRKNPLPLNKLSPQDRNLVLAIDAEAHRFAISYYRKLHRKKALRPY